MPSDKEQEILLKIGDKLKELRIKAGFTSYRKFADEHEIEPKQYWRMEEGKSDFRFTSLLRLLDIHGLNADEFLGDVGR